MGCSKVQGTVYGGVQQQRDKSVTDYLHFFGLVDQTGPTVRFLCTPRVLLSTPIILFITLLINHNTPCNHNVVQLGVLGTGGHYTGVAMKPRVTFNHIKHRGPRKVRQSRWRGVGVYSWYRETCSEHPPASCTASVLING